MAFWPPAKMCRRISVFVAFPPTLPMCMTSSRPRSIGVPFQKVPLSSPITRMFIAPTEGPPSATCEPPMLSTELVVK